MVRLWNSTTGDLILGPLRGHKYAINSAAYSPDGKHIITGSSDRTLKLWDSATGEIVQLLVCSTNPSLVFATYVGTQDPKVEQDHVSLSR